jgi:hypothetical protein
VRGGNGTTWYRFWYGVLLACDIFWFGLIYSTDKRRADAVAWMVSKLRSKITASVVQYCGASRDDIQHVTISVYYVERLLEGI